MTTNQTIDGVPRHWAEIEAAVRGAFEDGKKDYKGCMRERLRELRALLDADRCTSCDGSGEYIDALGDWRGYCSCAAGVALESKPSAQPQGEPVAWQYRVSAGPQTGWSLWHDGKGEEFKRSYQVETRPLYAEQPAPVAVEYKIHMGEALKVFDALKVERIARKVEQEDLGPMGATEVETWSTSIGVTLEMHTAMGGCTLIVRTATVAVVMPERVVLRDIIAQAIGGDAYDCIRVWSAWGVGTMSDDDFIPIVDQEERLYEIADACLDEVTRLNTK